jgi:hypothetical protein
VVPKKRYVLCGQSLLALLKLQMAKEAKEAREVVTLEDVTLVLGMVLQQ